MADLPADPAAAAVIRFLLGRHREIAKQLEGLDDAGVNWRPGADTNSIYEMLNHALDGELQVVSSIAGTPVMPDHQWNIQGTVAQAVARVQQADADLSAYLSNVVAADVGREIPLYGRNMSIALALSVGIGHTTEHMGHIQLTRQFWDQYGKTGVLRGSEA